MAGAAGWWIIGCTRSARSSKITPASWAKSPTGCARLDRLCGLNVVRQVKNVASDVFVQEAWARGQPLAVHGLVYSLSNGLITDLEVTVGRP